MFMLMTKVCALAPFDVLIKMVLNHKKGQIVQQLLKFHNTVCKFSMADITDLMKSRRLTHFLHHFKEKASNTIELAKKKL